jgi:WD40 repeat protein
VTSLSLSADGWTLLSGGRDSVVILWSLRDHAKLATIPVYEPLEGGWRQWLGLGRGAWQP